MGAARQRGSRSGRGSAALLALIGLVAPARAEDPSRRWYTLTTPHFEVHYYVSQRHSEEALARRVGAAAEHAHALLVPALRHAPTSRTHVVVVDETDGANGSASVLPYNAIRVLAAAPGSRDTLHDYDDYLALLLIHEYTHIVHLDTIHGLPRLVNAVLGRTWIPNQLQPRWFIEGLAVFAETRYTAGGRNRAALHDMMLRAAVLEQRLLELDQISSLTRHYPRGTVPYLYGGRFVAFLAERYGEAKLAALSHRYGGRPLPYGLNSAAREVFGLSFEQLYEQFKSSLRRRYAAQRAAAERRGLTPFRRLTAHGWSLSSPRLSRDGRELAFVESDGRRHEVVRVIALPSGRTQARLHHVGGETVAWTPDGRHVVYDQPVNWRTFHNYADLYARRRDGGVTRRLTYGLRAREPDVSPDGRWVAFVTQELGRSSVRLLPWAGGPVRTLRQGALGEQFFGPRWSPDGQWLALSQQRAGGRRDLVLLRIADGALRAVTDDRAIDLDPQFSADGRRVYFSSDRSGIFNVYCAELASGSLAQVTNVLGGAFAPAVSADERQLYYVGYSAKGYDLHAAAIDRRRWQPALPYVDDRPPARAPSEGALRARAVVRPYQPWSTLYPRAWAFDVADDGVGTSVGLRVDGADVVGRHAWAARVDTNTEQGYVSYGASYRNQRWWPTLGLGTSRAVGPRGGVVIDGRARSYVEENYGLSLTASLPVLRRPEHGIGVSLGYDLNWLRAAAPLRTVVLPGMLSPRLPETGLQAGISLGLQYDNVERYAESISAERGRRVALSLRCDDGAVGSDFATTQLSWSWSEFLPLPWGDEQVLALRYAGGAARGDLRRRGYFFLGGFPEQDLVRAVIELRPLGGAFLRGYAPGALYGDQYHLLNVEYRLPLFSLERGLSTLPVYVNYLHLAGFGDVGGANFGALAWDRLKVGIGAELLSEWVVGYVFPLTLRLGYARGLMEPGGHRFFALVGNSF